jgi:Putative beta-barrel porin-2, OmpL-like. bbp2
VHYALRKSGCLLLIMMLAAQLHAQTAEPEQSTAAAVPPTAEERISQLEAEVAELKGKQTTPAGDPQKDAQKDSQNGLQKEDRQILDFLRGTTLNVGLDGYYEYNFNHPVGRVNLLRSYDVLSNLFSLNQASVIFEHAPDVVAGRRWGGRLDLQFGQATDTLQGNPVNEPRPQIYRNIFQAFGTYVFPIGKGLKVDFGKWASSLGIENNYTKDDWNYSRSYWFEALPFYHMGLRGNLPLNDRISLNVWAVNGTNQTEAVNGFKDQLYGFVVNRGSKLTWTVNYYRGQENPDRIVVSPTSPIPVQPDLSFQAVRPAPDGRIHIFDTYGTFQLTPNLTFQIEGDYVIQRLWRHSGPGRSSAPSHIDGGAAYLQYQLNSKAAVATRFEYLSDPNGLFSGISQALKENTVTFEYTVADGFTTRTEWRRDYSNQPTFLTSSQGILSSRQNTITVGLIFWWGRKTGTW